MLVLLADGGLRRGVGVFDQGVGFQEEGFEGTGREVRTGEDFGEGVGGWNEGGGVGMRVLLIEVGGGEGGEAAQATAVVA